MKEIKISPEFKFQATKVILSILIFVITYIILLAASIGITIVSFHSAISLITRSPGFFTIIIGIGLASLGLIVFSFLIKFLFKSHKIDRSHLQEITKEEQPRLFALIHEIVDEVKTDFPKKVYLSPEVNASVFYNSSFWSMFFPVRKNLLIGMGLINTITDEELKSILAHEFGHFSQKSMKVGSYVYYVNQVIFNLLYENDDYDKGLQKWADTSSYLAIFVIISFKVVQAIQWILKQIYSLVNKSYLALSREMEFHADKIAASVTGYEPLVSSLLRMQLADFSLTSVFGYYGDRIAENQKSKNVFKEQFFVMNILAEKSELSLSNSLPEITLEHLNKFNKSKLIIKDQWASHPSTEDRIHNLKDEAKRIIKGKSKLANELINNLDVIQEELTIIPFKQVEYKGEVQLISYEEFEKGYKNQLKKNSFSKFYNGYYDDKNPLKFDLKEVNVSHETPSFEELFSESKVNLIYTVMALENDIEILQLIKEKTIPIKSFDYDGKRYKRKEASNLITRLKFDLEEFNNQIIENDKQIYIFFLKEEEKLGVESNLKSSYQNFFDFDEIYKEKSEIYTTISEGLQFINFHTDYESIRSNFKKIKALEFKLKKEINSLLENEKYREEITPQIKENFEKYIAEDLPYFGNTMYFDNNLAILFAALQDFIFILMRGYFITKKELLIYQENIIQ